MSDDDAIFDYLDQEYGEEEEEEVEEEEGEYRYPYIDILDAPRDLPEPTELNLQCLKDIATELGLIKLCWPEIDNIDFENRMNFPDSYLKNSNKEKLLLLYAENFRRQFCQKYPNRKQLFLASENECGLQKMVCTTIRPTTLPYPDLETWDKCAKFIGNQLKFEPFDLPTLIPNRLYSPHTTFLRQSGQPQELATVLCSLLLGLGYDAYVVFGYATRDVTLRIMSRVDSPYPLEEESKESKDEGAEGKKYAIKAPRDLRSKFLLMMEQREIDKKKAEEDKVKEAELEQMKKDEEPPFDELEGLRFHFWILLRTEGRHIDNTIFIEPSTGTAHPLDSSNYSGIECVWNNLNYWINMQDCSQGLGNIDYNLHDVQKWEHLLVGEPIAWREAKVDINMEEEEVALAKIMDEKHLDMPISWSLKIQIPHKMVSQKFPEGVQKTWYKRTLVEEYAPYVQYDGLVSKVTRFKDFDCTEYTRIEDIYQNRHDKMIKIVYDFENDVITEYFGPGREDAVIKHSYLSKPEGIPKAQRRIKFNHEARYDGLSKVEVDDENLIVHYIGRDDLFYFREVNYAKKGQPPPGFKEGHRKIIIKIVEKFGRNKNIPASENVATREFAIVERKIHLKYHYDDGKVTASTRSFIKPTVAEMGEDRVAFNPELTYGYHADFGVKPPSQLQLYMLLQKMMKEEEVSITRVRELEDQITEFLLLRDHELALPKLDVPLFNREENEEYRLGMLDKEKEEREHKEKEIEDEIDYLSPYLAQLGNPEKLTRDEAQRIRDQCLSDFKQLLLKRAINIQKQFEKATDFLKERQAWYSIHQDTILEEDEIKYFQQVNDLNFLLQCYEIRLARHRDLSPIRYEAMVRYLKTHLDALIK